ncbi:MAG: DUF2341 domain-containing protein, partial [Bacteroidales bacterium]|nr:DUF2341 domain-containing protein [Bacteroidales bacterium]
MITAISHINIRINSLMGLITRTLKKLLLVAGCWLLVGVFFTSFSQAVNDYRTNGNTTFNSSSNWERYDGSFWQPAPSAPNQNDGVITIRNGHTATLTTNRTLNQLVVESGGILTINTGQVLTLSNFPGTELDVYGTVNNYGSFTINAGATISFNANSIYNHTQNGGTIPVATWNAASNCNITGITTATSLGGFGQTFGNFTWNCPDQTSNFYIASNVTIAGDFTISGTGTFDSNNHVLRMSEFGTSYIITVNGDFVVTNNSSFKMNNGTGSCTLDVGGNFSLNSGYITIVTGGANSTLSVAGDVSISGGTLCMHEDPSATTGTLNVGGNFTYSGGTITETNSGYGAINFNGNTTQIYSKTGGTISNIVNFAVISGSVLDVGTSLIDGSNGTFTLNSGAGIITAHSQGLSNIAGTGSIRVTGTKTFSSGADYTYDGSVAQVTGNALPNTVHNLTVNNSTGVSLTNSVGITNFLTMTSGNVNTGANTLLISNPAAASLSYTAGIIVGSFERFINQTTQNYFFPVGTASQIQSLTTSFADLTSPGSLLVQYNSGDPGSSGFPLYDADGSEISEQFTTGYWSAQAKNSLASTNYNINLDATGFGPYTINTGTRVITRTGAGAWALNGSHTDAAGSVIKRTGLSGISSGAGGTQFGGARSAPRIITQPINQTVCAGSNTGFSITASGSGSLTYQWYKAPATLLTDDGHFGATSTNSLSISSVVTGDAGSYYCVITDQHGSQRQSNSATLTVNLLPAVTLGYAYQKTITIDGSKVVGTVTDFPVLISITDNNLRDNVENINGYDIIFSDINYNRLDHDLESYDAATGTLVVWVRVPTISNGTDTPIRMFYGNPQITTDQSSPGTWNSGYSGVWHLHDDYLDATSYANNGTNSGTTNVPGKIASGGNFDSANDYIQVGTTGWTSGSGTIEVWANTNAAAGTGANYIFGHTTIPAYFNRLQLYLSPSSSDLALGLGDNHTKHTSIGSPFANGTWYHVVLIWNGTNYEVFVNGLSEAAGTYTGLSSLNSIADIGNIGNPAARTEGWNGIIDEVRVSSVIRSSGWIQTEFNNQNNPSGFYSISSQNLNSIYDFDVCENTDDVIYSVPNQANQAYGWTVNGATGFSGNGTYIIAVDWGAAGTGQVSLTITNTITGCSSTSPVYSVIKNPGPTPVINGNLTVCPNKTNEIYNTPNVGGHSYDWNVTGAVSFTGDGTNQISVDWGPGPLGTVSVTETIDATGCNITANINVSIIDATPPTITCPGNISVDTDPGVCTATIVIPVPVTGDNCGVASVVNDFNGTGNASGTYPAGTTTVIWIVTDVNSNTATCSMTVTVTDNEDPIITCPGNVVTTTSADGTGNCTTTAALGTPTTSDNCSVAGVIAQVGGVTIDPATYAFPIGVTTVTWIVTDGSGRTASCPQTVTVTDNEDPTITCPGNVVTTTSADGTGNCTTTAALGTPTTSDNCSVAGVIVQVGGVTIDPATYAFPIGVTTVTWIVTDANGNTANCDQTVTVTDDENPTFTVPPDATVCRESDCSYSIDISVTGDVTDEADNCTPSILLNATFTDDASGLIDCNTGGFVLRTWTLIDIIGNTTTQIQTIWVEPTPTATIVVNTPVICGSSNVNIVIDSPTISTHPENLSFEIKVTSTDPANLGGTASVDFIITKAQMPYLLNGTLINTSDVPIKVTYTVNSRLAGCTGFVPVSDTIWVNPTPRVGLVTIADTILCDSTSTTIQLQSSSIFTSGIITFKYTAVATGGVTGFMPSASGLPNGYVITDNFFNPTNSEQTVTYTISPVSPLGCNDGPARLVEIFINPTPRLSVSVPDTVVCDSSTVTITVNDLNGNVHGGTTKVYQLTTTNPGGVLNVQPNGEYPAGQDITNQLINPTNSVQAVTYLFKARIRDDRPGHVGNFCDQGGDTTIVIYVNP